MLLIVCGVLAPATIGDGQGLSPSDARQSRADKLPANGPGALTKHDTVTRAKSFSVPEASNAYGLDLVHALTAREPWPANLVFSPYSISSAMILVAEGAAGPTAVQFGAAFHFGADLKNAGRAFSTLNARLVTPASGHPGNPAAAGRDADHPTLVLANGLWIQRDLKLLPAYLDEVQSHHGAVIQEADFLHDPQQAAQRINQWIGLQTSGRITHLIDQTTANNDTRIVLVNALYFMGKWRHQFSRSATRPADFKGTRRPQHRVQMMRTTASVKHVHRPEDKAAHHEGYQAIELPYLRSPLSMVIVLPDRNDGLPDLVKKLDLKTLTDPFGDPKKTRVDVRLPKFSVTSKVDLTPVLKEQVPGAFSRQAADFSNMTGQKDLRLSAVIHQTFLRVDETGSEAAATTGAVVVPRSEPETTFVADHPFLFTIRDDETKTVLFVGTITSP
jgi:serine protease inhibitor